MISLILFIKRQFDQKRKSTFNEFNFAFSDSAIHKEIKKRKIKLFLLDKISSPYVFQNNIVFPKEIINQLEDIEIEAIISHELSHIIWKDNLMLKVIRTIKAFFWYIPGFEFWIKKLSIDREYAADSNIKKFNISPINLAGAIKKVALLQNLATQEHVLFLKNKEKIFKRMKVLLKPRKCRFKWLNLIQIVSIFALSLMILFGKIWIF